MTTITTSTSPLGAGGAFAGVNVSGTFIPTLWSKKLLVQFYAQTMLSEICNTDY